MAGWLVGCWLVELKQCYVNKLICFIAVNKCEFFIVALKIHAVQVDTSYKNNYFGNGVLIPADSFANIVSEKKKHRVSRT